MTIPYGGTRYGLAEQQIDDARKHGITQLNFMEHSWGSYMGRTVYDSCRDSIKRPMKLLAIFEAAGKKAEEENRYLKWTLPITNFPVVQNYVEGDVRKLWIQYGPPEGERLNTGYFENTLQLNVCFIEDLKPSKGKQSVGAAPNAIHSLDACHMMLTTYMSPFPITTIHDSYGCLLGDMQDLFVIVREAFVELYKVNPIYKLMDDIKGDISEVEFGTLDIGQFINSEYGFV